MQNMYDISKEILTKKTADSSYNYYYKLEEAVENNELYEYLSSSSRYRCLPELGMESVNNFDCVVKNINRFLFHHPKNIRIFYNTITQILTTGNFYEVFSVSNIIRKQFAWQYHKITKIVLIDDNIFRLVRNVIPKFKDKFLECRNYTTSPRGMMAFYDSWNEFLQENTTQSLF